MPTNPDRPVKADEADCCARSGRRFVDAPEASRANDEMPKREDYFDA